MSWLMRTVHRHRMLFLTLFLSVLLQLAAAGGQYDYGLDIHPLLHARQDPSYLVTTGLADRINGNGTLPVRREIRDLQSDSTTWTLYILGLDMMMYINQTERISWYQIASIHGRPFTAWDGVEATAGNENNGYCNHVSILFSPWHRPYLALYEQVLYDIIQFIATIFPEGPLRTQYTAAAANFRIPYWDWAAAPPAGQNTVPDSIAGSDSVVVDGPNGVQTIHNPLFSYVFKPLDASDLPDPPMDLWSQTMRWPNSQSADAESQNSQMVIALENSATSLRNRLFNLFTNYANFTEFGTEAYSNTLYYDSLESIHDYIHGYTGNGGHMTYIEYSAFDPIFFLHHAMVDRCFALWQELYPNSWVVPEPSMYGTFTTSTGEIQDETSPLTPFRSDEVGGFWTSDSSRTTSTFGYAYPETAAGGNVTLQVINAINKLYGTTSPSSLTTRDQYTVRGSFSEKKNRDLAATNSNNLPTSITQGTKYREWITNIRVMKTALQEPFFIQIFLGPYNPDPSTWYFEPNLVGTHCIFTRTTTGMSACSDCASEQLVGGTVPLTSALLANIQNELLGSLDPAEVVPYLNQHLRYQVSTMNGTAYTGTIDSLSISVVSAEVQKLTDGHLPKWGVLQPEIDNIQCGQTTSSVVS